MATSAFKSTTKRTPIGTSSSPDDARSSNRNGSHRRSRSLSRFSGSFPSVDSDDLLAPRGKFVNTVRGSGFPEINLDDLANEFFPSKNANAEERGRSARRSSAVSPSTTTGTTGPPASQSQRRGRSVSRPHTRVGDGNGNGKAIFDHCSTGKGSSDIYPRRRRSASVARYQNSDSESDIDHNSGDHANLKSFITQNYLRLSLQKASGPNHQPTAPNHQRVLRRSMSQKDLSKSRDGYSSHSSALTDDEARDARSNKNGAERTIRAVYAQNKSEHPTGDRVEMGLYEAMRKELRHAVEEIRTELEQVVVKTKSSDFEHGDRLQSTNSDVLEAVSVIRRNYTTKLEQSEKRKQDLLAEIVVEEQRGKELSKIVRELLPDPKETAVREKPLRARKRSNDRSRMSTRLTEEAEKYFEDFISNVEDTDMSSFDGERSDASSTLGGTRKSRDPIMHSEEKENFQTPSRPTSLSVEMDGVVLPWLQWETSNDGSPLSSKSKKEVPLTPQRNSSDAAQRAGIAYNKSKCLTSSHGSWSPGGDSPSVVSRDDVGSRFGKLGSYRNPVANIPRRSWFDVDEYLHLQQSEDLLFESWRQRNRINSGGLIFCNRIP
ncbi:hypothetical protein HHK36_002332 [Tetracentron sinense]|uniref:Uncharacterized protein n=1 Tax=Tetracentron sinense TaxID=13715 RepID=A0A835DSF6_TETSI|nr:hypothetical protein HHK36_002332 [Tetracentron sinense]